MSKQLKPLFRNLLWLGGLAGLAVVVILLLSNSRANRTAQAPEPTPVPLSTATPTPPAARFDSPIATPTQPPEPAPTVVLPPHGLPTETPIGYEPTPTSTRPPSPPTRAPTPTFTPGPPTPTPEPLPTLISELDTLVYATTREQRPELYRVQVDETGQTVGPAYLISTADLWNRRTYLVALHPAPDGRRVAVEWVVREYSFVSILDVDDGQFTHLFGETIEAATFLDWSPDGNSLLALRSSAEESAWLIDVQTHQYSQVDVKPKYFAQETTSASFSPDGNTIVYARTDGNYTSEIWRMTIDGANRQLLFEDSEFRVNNVLWSPDGRYIAFTKSQESPELPYGYAIGELWVMAVDGSERRLLSSTLTGLYSWLVPAWSPNSQQITFLLNSDDLSSNEFGFLPSNVYLADLSSGQIRQLTNFQNTVVRSPIWSPNGSKIAFLVWLSDTLDQSEAKIVPVDGGESIPLVIGSDSPSLLVWLRTSLPGGQR